MPSRSRGSAIMRAWRTDQFGTRIRQLVWWKDGLTITIQQPNTGGFTAIIQIDLDDIIELIGEYSKAEALLMVNDKIAEVFK